MCEDIQARKQRHLREPIKQKGRAFHGPAFLFIFVGIGIFLYRNSVFRNIIMESGAIAEIKGRADEITSIRHSLFDKFFVLFPLPFQLPHSAFRIPLCPLGHAIGASVQTSPPTSETA